MTIWHRVIPISALSYGEVHGCRIEGRDIAIYHSDEGFFATADHCSHGAALLSEGLLDGCRIECPLHGAQFDIRTGEALSSPAYLPIQALPLRVRDGHVEVDVSPLDGTDS
ncbi:MAG TPA: non-heme iron oxygenase ferredoxin subunit [Sphingobium sp.]|nr:non-heme iron oxygenase ferredoxin subunit [Sphingobium sp.]